MYIERKRYREIYTEIIYKTKIDIDAVVTPEFSFDILIFFFSHK